MLKFKLIWVPLWLLWVGDCFGQDPTIPKVPPGKETSTTPLHVAPEPVALSVHEPAPGFFPDWLRIPFFWDTGPGHSLFTVDPQYVLWVRGNTQDSLPVANNSVLVGAQGTTIVGQVADTVQEERQPASGGRLALGYWHTQKNDWVPGGIRDLGAEAIFFVVGERSARFVDDSSPHIIRPFFDVNNRQASAFVVASPGLATGAVDARAEASIWGAEANVWKNIYYDCPGTTCSLNVMAGLRFLSLHQRLNIDTISVFNQNLAAFPTFLPFAGNTLQVSDSFATQNHFYGGQIGIGAKWWLWENACLDLGFKLALGATSEDLVIAGSQVRTLANSTKISSPAGVLALPSNIGNHHVNKFSQVPEADVKLSIPLLNCLTLSTGVSVLYWNRILRPALEIDRSLDISQIPNFPAGTAAAPTGLNQPNVPLRQSELLLFGLSVGLEFNW
jgi:hypothetical protein